MSREKTPVTIFRWMGLVVLTISIHLISTASGFSFESASDTFQRGLNAFDSAVSASDYEAAAKIFDSVQGSDFENGAAYYNAGNAYFRAGRFGLAILNYRKSKLYRPRDPYLEANLQQAIAMAPGRLPSPPEHWSRHVLFWTDWFAIPTKVRLAAMVLIAMSLFGLSGFYFRRQKLYWIVPILGIIGAGLIVDAALSSPEWLAPRRAVVIGETIARKGTGKDYEAAFDKPLLDGAEFTILEETADWVFGHFDGIGDGWVRREFIAK